MTRFVFICLICAVPMEALADVVVPTRTIRANAVISADDVAVRNLDGISGYDRTEDVIGQEARTNLYAGRPIGFDDIGPPALIDRNQIVPLTFSARGLVIETEGRSLQRGAVGDRIRIMNLGSRSTVFGSVQADGSVQVQD